MKKYLLIALLSLLLQAVKAQNNPVVKSIFTGQITKLSTAIDLKNLSNQNAALTSLVSLINTQLIYLKATRAALNTAVRKQQQESINSDIQIQTYVKGFLPATKIIADKTNLISQLNQFATTIQ